MAQHTEAQIEALVKKMTVQEKCSLLSGADFWHTKPVPRLDIPAVMVSDGPHGLRKQDMEKEGSTMNDSIEAVCFPAACATASSFDRDTYRLLGETLGDECQAQGVSTILGPAINIKRSPLCGRNFEYMSEDPYLAGELAASYINGVQSRNVGTSLKHFALNNQEYRRLTNSSDCDERTMREIYLAAFETAVKKAQPATIMHSYNRINGTYAGESSWLLTDVLRKEWGFEGVVVSDWGAVSDRVRGLVAGADVEMPSSNGVNDRKVEATTHHDPELMQYIDESCRRILRWVFSYVDNRQPGSFDMVSHHEVARKIEEESIVLLQNKGALPLAGQATCAVIGTFAKKPRFQGGGSSHINTRHVVSAVDALTKAGIAFSYAEGFPLSSASAEEVDSLREEALSLAKKCDVVLVFAGLPDSYESEGYDRSHLNLPKEQDELISALAAIHEKVVVVLHNGSPVAMPWAGHVNAILEAYLGGEAVGEAVVNVLTGTVNPSGKLAETFPLRIEDTPAFLSFANDRHHTVYREGLFVGYRYYEARRMDVAFPFGHGLSYTRFEYESLMLSENTMDDTGRITVTVTVRNVGECDGKEVVQLYVADKTGAAVRPIKELKGFEKVFISAGQMALVQFTLDKRGFAWYNTDIHDWYAASGVYEILIGSSSQDIRLKSTIHLNATRPLPLSIDADTTLGDLLQDSRTADIVRAFFEAHPEQKEESANAREAITPEMAERSLDATPLRDILMMGRQATEQELAELYHALQDAVQ